MSTEQYVSKIVQNLGSNKHKDGKFLFLYSYEKDLKKYVRNKAAGQIIPDWQRTSKSPECAANVRGVMVPANASLPDIRPGHPEKLE